MGRTPKPPEQKARLGNPGGRSLPVPIAMIPGQVAIPQLPDGLEDAGEKFWRDLWSVGTAWLSPQIDGVIVEAAARLLDEMNVYRRALAAGPFFKEPIVSASGKEMGTRFVPNPAAKMLRSAEAQLERWLVRLCVPPAERARLGLVQVATQSKLDELLSRRGQDEEILDVEAEDDYEQVEPLPLNE